MRPMTADTFKILASQNDAFRQLIVDAVMHHKGQVACQWRGKLLSGCICATPGVRAAFGTGDGLIELLMLIQNYTGFCEDNDPRGEHDFGELKLRVNGQPVTLYFKFDYYDVSRQFGSDDPAEPSVTYRALTVLLANEY